MSYLSEVLADSPTFYFPLDVYSSGFADSSGNSRPLDVISGTAPTATSGAPFPTTTDSAEWGASAGHVRTTYSQALPTVGTFEFWLWFSAAPAADLSLATWSPNSGGNGCCLYTKLLTTGKVRVGLWNGAFVNVDSPSALATSTWHHVIGSVGAAGTKLRVSKSTLATNAAASAASPASGSFRLHGLYNGASNIEQTGAVKMAHAAFYPTQLSDARTDAHFDAGNGDATVAVPVATATADALVPVVSTTATVDVPVAGATADALVPSVSTANDATVLVPTATATATALVPAPTFDSGTDTSNVFNGRSRDGFATVELEVPVAAAPGGSTSGTRVDKAVPLPMPVLVNGRPT